jgi:hypothetical protein
MFRTFDALDSSALPITLLEIRVGARWLNAFEHPELMRTHREHPSFTPAARRFIARNRFSQLDDSDGSEFGSQLDALEALLPTRRATYRKNEEVFVYYWPSPESVVEAKQLGLALDSFRPGWHPAYVIRRNPGLPEGASRPMMQLSWIAMAGPGDLSAIAESFWVHESEMFRLGEEGCEEGWIQERRSHKEDPGWRALNRI